MTGDLKRPPLADIRLLEAAGRCATVEVACDESGFEGDRLVGGSTDVFAHASVRISLEEAAESVKTMRERAPSPALEYKSHLIFRGKHRHALTWLLGPSGPLHGQARVYLVDKEYLVVRSIIGIAIIGVTSASDPAKRDEMAVAFYAEGPRALGHARWQALLRAANEVLRVRSARAQDVPSDPVAVFLSQAATLSGQIPPGVTRDVLTVLLEAGARFHAYRDSLTSGQVPSLDILTSSLVQAVSHWTGGTTGGTQSVSVIHDYNNLITETWARRVQEFLKGTVETAGAAGDAAPVSRLAALTVVDSRRDPRVQVADVLAGVARRLATDELHKRHHPQFTPLLRPFIDPSSVWGDSVSGAALGHPLWTIR